MRSIDLEREFGSYPFFAFWQKEKIHARHGDLLDHNGWQTIHASETIFELNAGVLINTRTLSYIVEDSSELYPGLQDLEDHLTKTIFATLSQEEIEQLPLEKHFALYLKFNTKGKVFSIRQVHFDDNQAVDEIFMRDIPTVLFNLPPLMEVNHPDYQPPEFRLGFSTSCLKGIELEEFYCKHFWEAVE